MENLEKLEKIEVNQSSHIVGPCSAAFENDNVFAARCFLFHLCKNEFRVSADYFFELLRQFSCNDNSAIAKKNSNIRQCLENPMGRFIQNDCAGF